MNDGSYILSFDQSVLVLNNLSSVYIRIYAGDGNVMVKNLYGDEYKTRTSLRIDGSNCYCDIYIHIAELALIEENQIFSEFEKAIYISQAVITARDYYREMSNRAPESVVVEYPSIINDRQTFYDDSTNTIHLSENTSEEGYPSFMMFDEIMHEYGHHVEHHNGMLELAQAHIMEENLIDTNFKNGVNRPKEYGVKTAWIEGWATAFAILAQQYYAEYLSAYPMASDYYYNFREGDVNDLENTSCYLGEGCELSICCFLIDIFDSGSNETFDSISLTHLQWYNYSTSSGPKTFTDYITNLYLQNVEFADEMGELLSIYKIAAGNLRIKNNNYLTGSAPAFEWDAQGGSENCPNNSFVFNMVSSQGTVLLNESTTNNYIQLTQTQWNNMLATPGNISITVMAFQTTEYVTGMYCTKAKTFYKPTYKTREVNGELYITGAYYLNNSIILPNSYYGKEIVGIDENAFSGLTDLKSVIFPNSYKFIGTRAFYNCTNLKNVDMSRSNIERIELFAFSNAGIKTIEYPNRDIEIKDYAFYNNQLLDRFANRATNIGSYAFARTNLQMAVIDTSCTVIKNNAFEECNNLSIYTANASKPNNWENNWNKSNRPVFWGCSLNNNTVSSFVKSSNNPSNATAINGISNPVKDNYIFDGWYTNSSYTGNSYMNVLDAPNGLLYAKWREESSSCVAAGTLITLADGRMVPVENLSGTEIVLAWDMEKKHSQKFL